MEGGKKEGPEKTKMGGYRGGMAVPFMDCFCCAVGGWVKKLPGLCKKGGDVKKGVAFGKNWGVQVAI